MGLYGPDVKCPCPPCYSCGGEGCDSCTGGIRCSKRRGTWGGPGLKVGRNGRNHRTIECKIDMELTLSSEEAKMDFPRPVYLLAFGRLVQALRKQGGQSQVDFAARVSLSQATLSRYERGSTSPDALEYKRMAAGLGFGLTVGDFDQLLDEVLEKALPMCRTLVGLEEGDWAAVSVRIDPMILRGVLDSAVGIRVTDLLCGVSHQSLPAPFCEAERETKRREE